MPGPSDQDQRTTARNTSISFFIQFILYLIMVGGLYEAEIDLKIGQRKSINAFGVMGLAATPFIAFNIWKHLYGGRCCRRRFKSEPPILSEGESLLGDDSFGYGSSQRSMEEGQAQMQMSSYQVSARPPASAPAAAPASRRGMVNDSAVARQQLDLKSSAVKARVTKSTKKLQKGLAVVAERKKLDAVNQYHKSGACALNLLMVDNPLIMPLHFTGGSSLPTSPSPLRRVQTARALARRSSDGSRKKTPPQSTTPSPKSSPLLGPQGDGSGAMIFRSRSQEKLFSDKHRQLHVGKLATLQAVAQKLKEKLNLYLKKDVVKKSRWIFQIKIMPENIYNDWYSVVDQVDSKEADSFYYRSLGKMINIDVTMEHFYKGALKPQNPQRFGAMIRSASQPNIVHGLNNVTEKAEQFLAQLKKMQNSISIESKIDIKNSGKSAASSAEYGQSQLPLQQDLSDRFAAASSENYGPRPLM